MPLGPRASAGDWIRDFRESSARQFRGKSPMERQRMALGAYYGQRRATGGLTDSVFRLQDGGQPTGSQPQLFSGTAGVDYSPGGMPAGGYQYNNPNFGNFGSNFPPGNTSAEGTGFPITAPPLPEGSQVLPDWVSPYGAQYGTAGYTPPPTAMATDPLGQIYGNATPAQGPINLSPAELQQFMAAGPFKGNANNPEELLAYISKFPAAVQAQMKPGGAFWGQMLSPDWNPATKTGLITSEGKNPWARTPEQLLKAGQQWQGQLNPNLQSQFGKWFNQNSALNGTGLGLNVAPQFTPQQLAMKQAALARVQAMPQVRRGPDYMTGNTNVTDWAGRLRALDQPLGPFGYPVSNSLPVRQQAPLPTSRPAPLPVPVRRRGGLV